MVSSISKISMHQGHCGECKIHQFDLLAALKSLFETNAIDTDESNRFFLVHDILARFGNWISCK